ncbi:hypothetical protein [uncultured Methanomethylovorans sp.]|uniref:hypothetical protein n=1 Tax=uncultured Methanomethylovorans sp. TaxID=183759 RepID=UPI002AA7E45D|nr:hypothetical protein [uncultured Methanomethylovorans sp.]
MNYVSCGECGNLVEDGEFCPNCGKALVPKVVKPKPVAENYSGKRGGSESKGKIKTYYGQGEHLDSAVSAVESVLKSEKMNPRVIRGTQFVTVKGKKTNFLRLFTGLNSSINIELYVEGGNLVTKVSNFSWVDKVIGGVLGIFFIIGIVGFFILVCTIYGTYNQYMNLPSKIESEIESVLSSKNW